MRPAPKQPSFGVGAAVLAWLGAFVFSNVAAVAILAITGYRDTPLDSLPLWLVFVLQIPLWCALVFGVVLISRHLGTGRLTRDVGLRFTWFDAFLGLPIGVVTQLVFVPLLYRVLELVVTIDDEKLQGPARDLTDRAEGLGVVLLVLLVVVGAPIVEELFYRGLLMRAIQARFDDGLALVVSSLLFGLAHIELLQLPALVLFGLVAGYLAQRSGRLGPAIFCHAGFNATTVVVFLAGWQGWVR